VIGEEAWPAPVPGFVAPVAGEHPRLLFRAADLPALKARAATPDGQRILAQLRITLGGGEEMPTVFSQDPPVNNVDEGAVRKHAVGTFTLSHGVGFGLLYQLSGEQRYADLGRECVERIFAGQVDRDARYNLPTPGTGFRLGFVYQSIALTYDLCYAGWSEDYRRSVVERCQTIVPKKIDKGGKPYDLETLVKADGYPPGSNHFGAYLLGPAMLALAFRQDAGADTARLDRLIAGCEAGLRRQLGDGFGDGGWFAEGTSCGRISANCGVLPLVQSLRVAAGHDWRQPRVAARATVLHLMHTLIRRNDQACVPHRGDYGDDRLFVRPIISHMGDFAQGMGAVLPAEAAAMRWLYESCVEPGKAPVLYDAACYPHLAVYAFVNWAEQSTDPDEILPRVAADSVHGYYAARNRWQDGDDIIVTALLKRGPAGYKGGKVERGIRVWGLGADFRLGGLAGKETRVFRAAADGSLILATETGQSLLVDFGGSSGADALLVVNDPQIEIETRGPVRCTPATVGGQTLCVVTLTPGTHPEVQVTADAITIGRQTVAVVDGVLTLKTFVDR
jgi:hypothetical protein